MGGDAPLIRLDHVGKWFLTPDGERREVLADVCLEVQAGEFVCVLGPSGCGKSTLIHLLAGFERPTSGTVRIDGQPVNGPDPSRILLSQDGGLLPWRTVLQNVLLGLEARRMPRDEARARAIEYLETVGMRGQENNFPHQISGGMRQRVALARALAVHPEVLFMDEPFAALDTFARFRLQDELLRLWRELKQTVLFVTHDLDEAVYLASRIVLLAPNPGRVEQTLAVHLDRPCDRTGPAFTEYRRHVYQAFELVAQAASDDTI
jgi:NitT/TauT family transport system ATP-binding protein